MRSVVGELLVHKVGTTRSFAHTEPHKSKALVVQLCVPAVLQHRPHQRDIPVKHCPCAIGSHK